MTSNRVGSEAAGDLVDAGEQPGDLVDAGEQLGDLVDAGEQLGDLVDAGELVAGLRRGRGFPSIASGPLPPFS